MKLRPSRRDLITGAAALVALLACLSLLPVEAQMSRRVLLMGGGSIPVGPVVSSSGGQVVSRVRGVTTIKFLANDTLTAAAAFSANVLVCGGGGGGTTAGGGAGQCVYTANVAVGTSTTITVGAGGAGASAALATAGSNSAFGTITATGGAPGTVINSNGVAGGGSGAGAASTSTGSFNGGPGGGAAGENAGGNTTVVVSPYPASGGGGCGTPGSSSSGVSNSGVGGNGGNGCQFSITGASLYYGGGGGGYCFNGSGTCAQGAGGYGGGGGIGGTPISGDVISRDGIAGLGGGGSGTQNGQIGGTGGSGIVIISCVCTVAQSVAAVTLPTTTNLAAFYSMVKSSGWAGNCMQVERSSDSTTLNIGFVNNVCDQLSADSFAAGSTLYMTKWYDQSGNGNDLTCNDTSSTLPIYTALNEQNNIRPIALEGVTGINSQYCANATLSLNSTALTAYAIIDPRTSWDINPYFEFTNAALSTSYIKVGTNQSSVIDTYTSTVFQSLIFPPAAIGTISASHSGSTGVILRVNGMPVSSATNATSDTIGGIQIGHDVAGYQATSNYLALAVYGATHTQATMAATEAVLIAPYAPPQNWTANLVYGGSSLISSWFSTANQTAPWQGGFGAGALGTVANWKTHVMAQAGRTLASECTSPGPLSYYEQLSDTSKTLNVALLDAPSNDFNSTTYTSSGQATSAVSTFFTGTVVPCIQALQAHGFAVVLPTIIARSGWDTTTNWRETARLAYNTLVTSSAATYNYTASDRAAVVVNSVAIFGSPAVTSNTTYYNTDGIHLVNLGYHYMESADKAAILSAP